jgi:alkylation response protein AidB-like acyl-CoA dehydrogenase
VAVTTLVAVSITDTLLAAVAKVYCKEMALRGTSEALQVHGG